MGNYWKAISTDYLIQSELALLRRAGLTHEDFNFHDTYVNLIQQDDINYLNSNSENMDQRAVYFQNNLQQKNNENYIHCVEIRRHDIKPNQQMPILILVHGYGAGGMLFYRILKDLAQYFHIFVVDLLGMGSSGRPVYNCNTVEKAEDFFVNSIRQWKLKLFEELGIKKEQKYYLAGHSLGGYLSSVYALKYQEEIIKLILLSPVGIPEKPQDFDYNNVAKRFDSVQKRIGAKVVLMLWDRSFTPFQVLRYGGSYGTHTFLKFYINKRMKCLQTVEEIQEVKNYLHQIFLRPASGEYALNTILSVGSWARRPLYCRLPQIKVPICFMYGSIDWMDPTAAKLLIKDKQIDATYYTIENADHHLYMDNPSHTVFEIIFDIFGEMEALKYELMKLRERSQHLDAQILQYESQIQSNLKNNQIQ